MSNGVVDPFSIDTLYDRIANAKIAAYKALAESRLRIETESFEDILNPPEVIYEGSYLRFTTRYGVQRVEAITPKRDIDYNKRQIANMLMVRKDNLPFRFWENVVMRDEEMAFILAERTWHDLGGTETPLGNQKR